MLNTRIAPAGEHGDEDSVAKDWRQSEGRLSLCADRAAAAKCGGWHAPHGLRQRRGPMPKLSPQGAPRPDEAAGTGAKLSLAQGSHDFWIWSYTCHLISTAPRTSRTTPSRRIPTGINRDTKKAIVIEHQESSICPTTINARTVVAPVSGSWKWPWQCKIAPKMPVHENGLVRSISMTGGKTNQRHDQHGGEP